MSAAARALTSAILLLLLMLPDAAAAASVAPPPELAAPVQAEVASALASIEAEIGSIAAQNPDLFSLQSPWPWNATAASQPLLALDDAAAALAEARARVALRINATDGSSPLSADQLLAWAGQQVQRWRTAAADEVGRLTAYAAPRPSPALEDDVERCLPAFLLSASGSFLNQALRSWRYGLDAGQPLNASVVLPFATGYEALLIRMQSLPLDAPAEPRTDALTVDDVTTLSQGAAYLTFSPVPVAAYQADTLARAALQGDRPFEGLLYMVAAELLHVQGLATTLATSEHADLRPLVAREHRVFDEEAPSLYAIHALEASARFLGENESAEAGNAAARAAQILGQYGTLRLLRGMGPFHVDRELASLEEDSWIPGPPALALAAAFLLAAASARRLAGGRGRR